MKLGLENITRLLRHLGDPQNEFPAVLVAGTNGKGSVTTFLSSILRSKGLRVGTFYSPHLFRLNERIRLNGEEIPSPVLDEILDCQVKFHGDAPFTFFEGMTAAAIVYFARNEVDMAIFEVGLGGRLDATRLVNAVATVITGISFDHREHLGKTRHRILKEKLGIVRRGVPLVANLDTKGLVRTAGRHCSTVGTPFYSVGGAVRSALVEMCPDRMVVDIFTPEGDYEGLATRMIGKAQVGNIATAVRTIEVIVDSTEDRKGKTIVHREGTPPERRNRIDGDRTRLRKLLGSIYDREVRAGIGSAFLAGRFQVLPGRPRIIMDVSHNEEALLAALDTLERISTRKRNVIVFGVLANKELGRFPARALRTARQIILTPLKDRRSAGRKSLAGFFVEPHQESKGKYTSVMTVRGMAQAIRTAREILQPDYTLLILGSHLTVEEAAGHL